MSGIFKEAHSSGVFLRVYILTVSITGVAFSEILLHVKMTVVFKVDDANKKRNLFLNVI